MEHSFFTIDLIFSEPIVDRLLGPARIEGENKREGRKRVRGREEGEKGGKGEEKGERDYMSEIHAMDMGKIPTIYSVCVQPHPLTG